MEAGGGSRRWRRGEVEDGSKKVNQIPWFYFFFKKGWAFGLLGLGKRMGLYGPGLVFC